MNNVILIGRLSNDPKLTFTPSQMGVCKFNLAIDRGKDAQGQSKGADFPRITVFGKQGENAEKYLTKGRLVAIQGRVTTGSYKDNNGNTVYTTDIVADRVEYLEYGDKKAEPKEELPQDDFKQLEANVPW